MPDKINFDIDNYEPSDSEEEYTAREKSLISKVRESNKKRVESDEEVLGFSDDDEQDSDLDNDEIKKFQDTASEGEEDDDLPDSRAWGKKKRAYYNTDFVDKDYSQYTQEEEELAAQEWEEAKQIRQRLTKQLNDNDFSLDVFSTEKGDAKASKEEEAEQDEAKLKTDLTDLSEREKKQLFKRDAPEFEGLVNDMLSHLEESETLLTPFLDYCKENLVEEIPVIKFVKTFNSLLLNYSNNVSFYLLLKSKRVPIKNHPVVKRLVQVRKLIEQLNERYQDIVRPQIEAFLEDLKANNVKGITTLKPQNTKSKKMLNIMKPFEEDNISEEEEIDEDEPKMKKLRTEDDEEGMEVDEKDAEEEGDEEEMGKRSITYQMSKNKGLHQRKKPENRNPRVKNKNKYRKAVIRRKGSVREVRKETSRYGGEATGIKAFVKRSVTIK
ncbi:something about silencing protein 10 [Culicoides brevitarsis]|uniref:something about silencing protein 10 n=1 Tax=Culicoides brevitarsis TaxID=469753 RepID=UPI00307B76DC